MKKIIFAVLCFSVGLSFNVQNTSAQDSSENGEVPRFEIGAQFSSLNADGEGGRNGFGGRFTVNFNQYLAAEAESNFFPGENFFGRATQFVAGVKAGKRWDKFGVFGKARPGFVYYTRGRTEIIGTNISNAILTTRGTTNFAADLGGVLEFYPSKRIVTRFDAGDTIVRFGSQTVRFFDQNGNIQSFNAPGFTRHYFQFSAGIGFRF